MKNWVICGRSAIVSVAAAILLSATPSAAEAQTTYTVCPPGNPSAPCDYDSPDAALNDPGVFSGDTLEIANDVYTLTGTLLVDRGLTLNFNDSIVDANGVRAVSVDGASLIDANVANLDVNGVANWAPFEDIAYGQTFTSTATELLTAFQFQIVTSSFPDTITIPGVVRSGGIGGPIIATASATFGPANFETVTTTFHLDQPVELVQGNVYAVEYTPTANTRISQALNPYAGGTGYNTGDVGFDYAFAALGGRAVSINDVTIRNGQAPAGPGGALRVSNGAVVTLSGSTVENNTAPDGGGGLANVNSYLTVSNSDISGNSTIDAGGGVLTEGFAASTILSQTTIDGNVAEAFGGGVAAISDGRIDVVDSVISRNAALSPALADSNYGNVAGSPFTLGCGVVGQTITASVDALSSYRFRVFNSGFAPPGPGVLPDDVTVQGRVRSGGPQGPIIANASALVPAGTSYQIQLDLDFLLDQPVGLVIGDTYALEMTFNGPSVYESANTYAGGFSYGCGLTPPDPASAPDLEFQTFGGTPGQGGGVFSAGAIELANTTVSGNLGDGGFASAGDHSISALLSTISNNSGNGLTAQAGGAGPGGVIAIGGSILAGNGADDCNLGDSAAVALSQDYNLIGDLSGCAGGLLALQPNDQAGGDGAAVIDPLLGPLQDNGGPTRTQALDPASPAVDSGASDPTCGLGTAPFADQRGIARPQGAACDAGAFELLPPLQSLIDLAPPGGTVIVPGGIYNESIVLANSGIILQGSGPDNVVINATGLGTPGVTATESFTMIGMRVTGANVSTPGAGIRIIGSALDVVLNNVRIDNNVSASLGGGIFADINSRLTATNVQIDNNSALDGGGIYTGAFADSIVFDNVQILSNTATRNGGGIYAESADSFSIGTAGCAGAPTPGSQSNIIANNTAPAGQGGGIYDARSDFAITDTRFTGNEAVDGGAMFHSAFNTLGQTTNISCSVLGNNLATGGSGGANNMAGGNVIIGQSLFQSNTALAQGGAINLAAGALTISQSVFESNAAAAQGGAINDLDGTLTVSSTEFRSNSAPNGGGAINTLGSGNVSVAQSTFRNNFSAFGGGGAVRGTLSSENNLYDANSTNARGGAILAPEQEFFFGLGSVGDTFTNNTARDGGGAIAVDESQTLFPPFGTTGFGFLTLTNGLFTGNQVGEGSLSVSGRGGAIEFSGTQATVENTEFINNTAPESGDGQSQGGAIFAAATDAFTISNSTISGSSAGDGGAIYNEGILSVAGSTLVNNSVTDFNVEPRGGAIASTGTLNVSNSTISGNVVNPGPGGSGDGGAIASFAGGIASLNNVTLAFNSAPDGGALFAEPNLGELTFSNSLFFGNTGVTEDCDRVLSQGFNIYDANICQTLVANDLIGDPLIGLLTDNGGPTETHALLPGSPAQDAGAPASCELVDQRGVTRPQGLRCDIGAFEGSAIPGTIDNAVLGVTTNVSEPGVIEVPLIDIPIEKLTGVVGDSSNPPESAPLSSFPLSSFPLSSLDLRASPLSSFPLSSFPLSSFDVAGAPLSSFPLSSFPLLSEPGGWAAVIEQISSLAGAPLQNVTLEQVLTATDRPAGLLDNITLGSFAIQGSPLSSLSLAGLSLGDDITVAILDEWLANAGSSSTVCGELLADGFGDCQTTDTVVSLQVKSAPLSSLPLSSLPLSSFPLSSLGITEAPLSSLPLSSLPLSSFPLSSFPLSSFPLSSLPLSSFPLSSLPLSSFPLSSLDLLFAPLSSLPLSSFPLSSLPLSSFEVGGQSFCQYYDALAAADGQPTCSSLGIDPASDGLLEMVAALQGSGAATLAATPLSSFPLSSFDISSVPLSSFRLDFADVAGLPLSSFPLSSLPLSSLDVGSQGFCDFYDAAAIAEGQATCGLLGIGNDADFGELIAALQANGQSTFASTPLSSFPLSSLPLSSLPLSSFPLSSLEINGAPLSSFPLSSFDILGSPLSSLPLSSLPLSSLLVGGSACDGCTTLGDAFAAGQVITDAPLSSLTGSSEFGDIGLGDLLSAFTLEYLFGVGEVDPLVQTAGTLGEIADPGNLTLGQLLVSLILRSDFPWENISLSDLDPQVFAADNVVGYSLDFELNGTLVDPVTVNVTLSDQFYLVPGSARFVTRSQSGSTPLLSAVQDPVMTPNLDGTVTLSFGPVFPGAFSDNTLEFVTVPPLALGNFPTTASLALGSVPAATADASAAAVEVVPSANNDSGSIEFPASTRTNTLILGHINAREDIDYFRISAPPKGSRVAVFLANPGEDNDLLLYEPLSTVEAKGQTIEAASLDSIPFEDDGVDFSGNRLVEPDALEDSNIGTLPLSSLSTNRGDSDELVSAISDGEDFTIQVSGYNGSVSDQPYTLRVKVKAEVPVTQCSARTWTTGATGPQDWTPAGSWQSDTNAVFLVNWQRLADSEQALTQDGAAAADAALNAVNALVNAPGVVNGVVVDVATIPGVNYAPWDLDPCDVDAANSVVNAITAYLEQQRAVSPSLAYVTIVGSDEVIPFKRKEDETEIANESTFATNFADNALYGSMVSRNFLSDDTYGDIDPVKWSSGRFLNVPELAVGRLVESAADIRTAAENYLLAGGVLTPTTALSAGYDFVADASADIQQTFSTYGLDSTALVDEPNAIDPWDRSRFLADAGVTANDAKDVVSFNMHFDYDEALPSSGDATGNYSDNLINVADLLGDPTGADPAIPDTAVDLTGRIWFTVGCHSGINAADIAMLNGEPTQDWAQTLNSLGAVYVGQAAYGLGDTVALALTERLMANFARNLNGNVTTGQAHAFAKQDYFKDLGVYGEYDYKAMQASVYFGLPMYRIQNPLFVEEPLSPLRPVVRDPISNLNSLSLTIEPNVTRTDGTEKGTLFSVDGNTQFVHYRPLQPIIGVDVTSENPDEVARSAFITGLVTRDELVTDMAFARPVISEGALEPEIETDEVIFPTRFANISSYRAPADPGPFEDRQQLNIIAGQYTSNAGQDFGTQRIFTSVDVQVFYQSTSDTAALQADVVPLSSLDGAKPRRNATKSSLAEPGSGLDDTRPELANINASVVQAGTGIQAAFTVDASDTVGVVTRVAVLYRQSFDGQNSTWVLEDLVKGSGNTWTGGAAVDSSGLINGQVDYLVQALDDSGNVAYSTFKGAFYAARETPLPPPPSGGDNGSFGIELKDSNGDYLNPGEWSRVDPVVVSVTNKAPGMAYEFALDSPNFQPLGGEITVTGDGVHFVTVREVGGGNSATFTVLIDTTSPNILVTSPAPGQFIEMGDDLPVADYECLDSGSGPAFCSAPVAAGQPVPATTPGTQAFGVSSRDFAGNSPTSVSNDYYVVEPLTVEASEDKIAVGTPLEISGAISDLAEFIETVNVDWGDGTSETLTLIAENGGWTFSGQHEYAVAQSYTAVVVTADFGGAYQQTRTLEFAVVGPAGLWAQDSGESGIVWSGGAGTVDGLMHSNSDINITGSRKTVNGPTRYGNELHVRGSGHTFATSPVQVGPADWPFAFQISDYGPGGTVAQAVGSQFFDMSSVCNDEGKWELDNDTAPGLYWVPCDVQVQGSRVVANVTVVSNDTITVTGSRHEITPFVDGLVFFTNVHDKNSIKISSSRSDFNGYVVSRRDRVLVSSSNQTFGCGIAGQEIKLSGSGRTIGQNCSALSH